MHYTLYYIIHYTLYNMLYIIIAGPVDGYVEVDGTIRIYEFLGCYHHGCSCGAQKDPVKREQKKSEWEAKRRCLERCGELHYIWECHWEMLMAEDPEIEKTVTHFPNIMKRHQTQISLINQIKDGTFFGFVHCDLW